MLEAGQTFVQSGIPYTSETEYDFVAQEPKREFWQIGERETQYGHESDGTGRFEVRVLEVLDTCTSGPVVIYERVWFDPDGELLSKPKRKYSKASALKALISRRKMAQIDAHKAPENPCVG